MSHKTKKLVEFVPSPQRKKKDQAFDKWGKYLYLRGTKWQGATENYTMSKFLICTLD
jgi:hypothetical protein